MRYRNQRLMRIILTKNSTNFNQNKTQHRKAIPKITKRHCDSSLVLGSNRYFTNTPGINAIKTTISWMRFIATNVFKYSVFTGVVCLAVRVSVRHIKERCKYGWTNRNNAICWDRLMWDQERRGSDPPTKGLLWGMHTIPIRSENGFGQRVDIPASRLHGCIDLY